jgi:hypothetical protein
MHLTTIQALIDVYYETRSSIVDLSTSTNMYPFSKKSFTIYASIFLSNHLSPCRQHNQGLPKPWVPHPNLGIGYGGFYEGVGTFHLNGHA